MLGTGGTSASEVTDVEPGFHFPASRLSEPLAIAELRPLSAFLCPVNI